MKNPDLPEGIEEEEEEGTDYFPKINKPNTLATKISDLVKGTMIGITILALGFGGYFGYDFIKNEPKRKVDKTEQALTNLQDVLRRYKLVTSSLYPDSLNELEDLGKLEEWKCGGYWFDLKDAWGKEFNYRSKFFAGSDHYELSSSGPDGIPQTSDDIQAKYNPGHEWGSIDKLEEKCKREYEESKPALQKFLERAIRH